MAAEEDNDQQQPQTGGKKTLLIGLFAGLVVGAGAGVGAFMMIGGDEQATAPVEQEVVEEKPKVDTQFVKLERVTIPMVYKARTLGNIVVDFSLEVDGNDNKMTLFRHLPEIRDAVLRHYSEQAVGKTNSPRNVDYPRLKKTLKGISNKVLDQALVKRVMVVQIRQF